MSAKKKQKIRIWKIVLAQKQNFQSEYFEFVPKIELQWHKKMFGPAKAVWWTIFHDILLCSHHKNQQNFKNAENSNFVVQKCWKITIYRFLAPLMRKTITRSANFLKTLDSEKFSKSKPQIAAPGKKSAPVKNHPQKRSERIFQPFQKSQKKVSLDSPFDFHYPFWGLRVRSGALPPRWRRHWATDHLPCWRCCWRWTSSRGWRSPSLNRRTAL